MFNDVFGPLLCTVQPQVPKNDPNDPLLPGSRRLLGTRFWRARCSRVFWNLSVIGGCQLRKGFADFAYGHELVASMIIHGKPSLNNSDTVSYHFIFRGSHLITGLGQCIVDGHRVHQLQATPMIS